MGNNYQNFSNQLSKTALYSSNIIGQMDKEKQQLELTTLLSDQDDEYRAVLEDIKNNVSDYKEIPEQFQVRAKEIHQRGSESLTGPWAQQQYQIMSQKMTAQYRSTADSIHRDRLIVDGKHQINNLLQKQSEKIHFDKATFDQEVAGAMASIDQSSFYLPEEKEAMKNEWSNIYLNKAVMAGATQMFHSSPGDYTQKVDASLEWLTSDEGAKVLGNISADDLDKVVTEINLLGNREFTKQTRYRTEHDDQADRKLAEKLIDGSLAIQDIDEANFFDADRMFKWMERAKSLAVGGGSSSGKAELDPAFYDWMNDLAADPDKDISFKNMKFYDKFTSEGYPPELMKKGLDYLGGIADEYQNPAFKNAMDNLSNGFKSIINEEKEYDGVAPDQLSSMKAERVQILRDYFKEGNYSPEQMMQISNNLLRELQEEEISLELERRVDVISGMRPETINKVKGFEEMLSQMDENKYMGVEDFFRKEDKYGGNDLHQFETVYDEVMTTIGPELNLKKYPGQYRDNGKPLYSTSVDLGDGNSKEYAVEMMSDGTVRYWVQYRPGDPAGEWVDMNYSAPPDFVSPNPTGEVLPVPAKETKAPTPSPTIDLEKSSGNQSVKEAEFNPYTGAVGDIEVDRDRTIIDDAKDIGIEAKRFLGNLFGGRR